MSNINKIVSILNRNRYPSSKADKEREQTELSQINISAVDSQSIAIIENFDFHGECLPSYINYFIKLGYKVNLFTIKEQAQDPAWIDCNFDPALLNIYSFTKFPTDELFFNILSKHRFVFLSTLHCKYNDYFARIFKEKYCICHNKNNYACINHELYIHEELKDLDDYFFNNTFALRPNILCNNNKLPFIAPIYFGLHEDLFKNTKNNYVTFLSMSRQKSTSLKNYEALFQAVNKLIKFNIKNFKIIFTGLTKDNLKQFLTQENENFVELLEKVPFKKLYEQVKKSDYVLYNIDKTSSDYIKYINMGTTATYLHNLGFIRPAVVDTVLAEKYFIADCSITYGENELFNALKKAIELSNEEYITLQKKINVLAQSLTDQSVKNIEEYLNNRNI